MVNNDARDTKGQEKDLNRFLVDVQEELMDAIVVYTSS
jgi:hypothetical protein